MTGLYVASNVQSLVSQHQINRNMADLGNILTRLSTGLRINSGKDDPAGLIASELLKSDITATSKAITNAQRANSVISIADSALGQVSNLLNDIRGLVNEAANTGAMTAEQIAANQLQVDASLDSIDRIAKTTNFQGQLLLDGSMGFQTQGVDINAVRDFTIHQANFGTQSQVDIGLNVLKNSDNARLFYDKAGISNELVLEVGGNQGYDTFKFEAGATVGDMARAINQVSDSTGVRAIVGNDATHGQIMLTSAGAGSHNDINLMALTAGAAAGNYTVKYSAGNANETTYTITEPNGSQPGVIDFKLKMQEKASPAVTHFDESFNGLHTYDISGGDGIIVQTTDGTELKHVEFVAASADAAGSADGHTSAADENTGLAVTFDKKNGKLHVLVNDGSAPTAADWRRAIDAIDGLEYVSGDGVADPGFYDPTDLRANNALDIAATVAGSKFENTDIVYVYDETVADLTDGVDKVGEVALAYKDGAQFAAATIRWGDGSTTDPVENPPVYDVQMRIVADKVGAEFNDVTINFEQDDTYTAGDVSAVYDADRRILHVRGQIDNQTDATLNATYGTLKKAIDEASPFRADITIMQDDGDAATVDPLNGTQYPLSNKIMSGLVADDTTGVTPNTTESSYIKTGQQYGDIGTDNQALFVRVGADTVTATDVVAAFNDTANAPFSSIAANFTVANAVDSDGTGTIFNATLDNLDGTGDNKQTLVRVATAALTGGADGFTTDVTAAELIDFINTDSVLSTMFLAAPPLNGTGQGLLTLFDEAAYYGDPNEETGLQFLGPEGSANIMFVTDGPNSDLGISFDEASADCIPDDRPVASLLAKNANAAFSVQSLRGGDEYDDMAIRMIRLDNNHIADPDAEPPRDDSYVQYKAGPSNAMAYCSINDNDTGSTIETGKFIVYGTQGGTQLNDVEIIARLDESQTAAATATYDEESKQLIITVNSNAMAAEDGGVTLSDAVAAINNTGIFRAEYDYSFNTTSSDDTDTGPGLETFGFVFAAAREVTIGNTGSTGGHNGVLEVYVAGDETQITAQRVVDTINNDPVTGNMFAASAIGGTGAGTGLIDFREDNIHSVIGSDGKATNVTNMSTSVLGSTGAEGMMIIHLATDANGNSITSSRDLVDFMNQLTAEQTRGVSVSMVRPAGVDNLNRTWTDDGCGNLIMSQACDDDFGKGILQPTLEVDDCGVETYYPIEFASFGENIVPGNAFGNIVAVNGKNASLQIRANAAGPDFNGVGFKYVLLEDPLAEMYAEFDAVNKEILVNIHAGTTAAQVANIINSSEQTRDLFTASLAGDGTGQVTTQDDYLVLKGGLYDNGYRGGALILGAADADEHSLIFESMEEGTSQKVQVRTIQGDFDVRNAAGVKTDTDLGEDMLATINGITMVADGRKLKVDSSMLKMDITLEDRITAGDTVLFSITGGGATFQLGPDVVSNQQIRLGIGSINTGRLGGASGRLYQLRGGGNADLSTDTKLADRIVQEAILSVASTRGRLGAIQRSTLDPAISSLQDSLEQLSAAEAQISNADFAEESSKLTRAQILVQAGTRTLSIANQFPQYAASLVGG